MITWIVIIALALLVVALLLVGLWAFQTANRLDRLHVRYDLSWQALDGLLARRAVVARAVAVDAYGGGPDGKRLAARADAAERAPRTAREAAENELSAPLALVDPASLPVAVVAELADAEAPVGEPLRQAAVRELAEETGLRVDPAEMIGPVWRRDAVIDFNGSVIRSEEMFFIHRTPRFEPSTAGRTGLERAYIHGHRWCDATMISELVAKGETVYPLQLGELLDEANVLADARGGAPERQLQSIR